MSKLARVLVVGATAAAMNLASLTAVAHARANDDPDGKNAQRLVTERQARETWRKRPPVTSQRPRWTPLSDSCSRSAPSIPSGTPAPTRAAEPSGQPGWLLASLGGLAGALALITRPHHLAVA
jgi:hypothetical protein